MQKFRIFGGCLEADLPFPELRPSRRSRADWVFRSVEHAAELVAPRLLGSMQLPATEVRLLAHAAGYRMEFDDTGVYDVLDGGATIEWSGPAQASLELVRMDVMNRVLPVALHAAGAICLHGSAVAMPAGAICFLAPKFHGKSTLAMALTARGGRLLTDDTVAVDLAGQPVVHPGVHSLRLWHDSADRFADASTVRFEGAEGKRVILPSGRTQLATRSAPLHALYLLRPRAADGIAPAVSRTRLSPVPSAIALLGQTRLGELLGGPESATTLDRAVTLAQRVPVFELSVVRDMELMDTVIDQLMDWHGGAAVPAPAINSA
jgi:hypothetical protein